MCKKVPQNKRGKDAAFPVFRSAVIFLITIEPILKSLSGYNSLDAIENWLNTIPNEPGQVWEEKTRNRFLMLAHSGPSFIQIIPVWEYDKKVSETFMQVFSHLYEVSSPEILQELLSEKDESYDDHFDEDFGENYEND